MKKIAKNYWFFISIFFLTLLIPTNVNAQFDIWVEATPIFTIAKTESVNVYVKNLEDFGDNYTVTFTTSPPEVSHLISVHIPNNRTRTLKTNETGNVLARVTLLGPVGSGSITFRATRDSDGSFHEEQIQLITGSAINLPEFGLIGLIQLLMLASLLLVVSYSSHFR